MTRSTLARTARLLLAALTLGLMLAAPPTAAPADAQPLLYAGEHTNGGG